MDPEYGQRTQRRRGGLRSRHALLAMCVCGPLGVLADAPRAGGSSSSVEAVEVERGGFATLDGATVPAGGDGAWAVGRNGIVRYSLGNWRLVDTLDRTTWLRAVDSGRAGVWAVGDHCQVIRLDVDVRELTNLPWDCYLSDVAVTDDDVWAVGGEHTADGHQSLILHFDGISWRRVAHPLGLRATAVWMDDQTAGWVALSRSEWVTDVMLYWNGHEWSQSHVAGLTTLVLDIDGAPVSQLWAVGGATWRENRVDDVQLRMLFEKGTWQLEYQGPGEKLRDVEVETDGSGWAVGSGGVVLSLEGNVWGQAVVSAVSPWGLAAVVVLSKQDVWFVGDAQVLHYNGDVFRFWGGGFRYPEIDGLSSISARGDTVWAAGWGGPPLRRVNGAWDEHVGMPNETWIHSGVAVSSTEYWAAYAVPEPPGRLAHYKDGLWAEVVLDTPYPILDFSSSSPTDVWAVASGPDRQSDSASDILHYDGSNWTRVHSTSHHVRAIDLNEGIGWAVGEVLLPYENGAWKESEIVTATNMLLDVDVEPEGTWAVGWREALVNVGGMWMRNNPPFSRPSTDDGLNAVRVAPDGSTYIAGDRTIWRYESNEWVSLPVRVAREEPFRFAAIEVTGSEMRYSVWLAGVFDTIVRIDVTSDAGATVVPSPTNAASATPRQTEVIWMPHVMRQ